MQNVFKNVLVEKIVSFCRYIMCLFLAVTWVGLQCVIVLFPDHAHLLLEAVTKIIDSVALFGTFCIGLTNVHKSNRYEACNIIQTMCFCCKKQGL